MSVVFITFRSVTPAQRGEGILKKAGIRCTLGRTPGWMEQKGCGYCLRLRPEWKEESVNLLRDAQVPFRKVYVQHEDGSTEELAL